MKEKSNIFMIIAMAVCTALFAVSLFAVVRGCDNDKPKAEASIDTAVRFTSPPTYIFLRQIQYYQIIVFDSLNPDTPAMFDIFIPVGLQSETDFHGSYQLIERNGLTDGMFLSVSYLNYVQYVSLHNLSTAFIKRSVQGVEQYFVPSVGSYARPYWYDIDYVPISDTTYPSSSLPDWDYCFRFRWFFSENKSLDTFYIETLVGNNQADKMINYHYSYWLGDGAPDTSEDYLIGYQDGLSVGYNEGYNVGADVGNSALSAAFNSGEAVGYQSGINAAFTDISPFWVIVNFVDTFLQIKLFGTISLAWIFTLQFGFLLLGLVIKFFLGG